MYQLPNVVFMMSSKLHCGTSTISYTVLLFDRRSIAPPSVIVDGDDAAAGMWSS